MSLSTEEWEMGVVQLLVDAVVQDVFQDRSPSAHLVGLLVDPLFFLDLPHFLSVALEKERKPF